MNTFFKKKKTINVEINVLNIPTFGIDYKLIVINLGHSPSQICPFNCARK